MESVDLVLYIMFMKNIMIKSKQMTEALQAENLNVVDAMTIIMATAESLKRINDDEKQWMTRFRLPLCSPRNWEIVLKLNSAVNIV